MKKGCKYGTHRVIEPLGVLPQPAKRFLMIWNCIPTKS